MASDLSKQERSFRNTFAPHYKGEILTMEDIICGLRYSMIKMSLLPPKIGREVQEEINRRLEKDGHL